MVGYVDNHSLLKIIPDKSSRIVAAASHLNSNLAALIHFDQRLLISFAPQMSSSLIISLKRDLASFPHPLLLNNTLIPETSSLKILGLLLLHP